MVDVAKQVNDLNAGWYNVVTKAMGIDVTNFQLAQGTLGLQTADSSGLFLMADAVPPPTAVAYFDPAGLSRRSGRISFGLARLPSLDVSSENQVVSKSANVAGSAKTKMCIVKHSPGTGGRANHT